MTGSISTWRRCWPAALMACTVLLSGGCSDGGPELGTVSGKVTLDGQPLADALVTFVPEKGRSSSGRTNEEGEYELKYTPERSGAVLGNHIVRITTVDSDSESRDPAKEKLPAQYNIDTELEATVESGENEKNFDLSSKGGGRKPRRLPKGYVPNP